MSSAKVSSDAGTQVVGHSRRVREQQRSGLADEGVPAGVLLPAPPVAAFAAQPVRNDLHVAELARDAEPAPFDPAAEHDPATDTGPEVDHDQMVLSRPAPNRHSAQLEALASLSTVMGSPIRSNRASRSGS